MRKGPFISLVAAGCGIEEKTVRIFARELIDAGLLSSGGRGINAPHMTLKDLATMLVALLATDKPARAVEMVQNLSQMQLSCPDVWSALPKLPKSPDHSFSDLMECLCCPDVTVPARLFIEVTGTAHAVVWNDSVPAHDDMPDDDGVSKSEVDAVRYTYIRRDFLDLALRGDQPSDLMSQHGLVSIRRLSGTTNQGIKDFVFADHESSDELDDTLADGDQARELA